MTTNEISTWLCCSDWKSVSTAVIPPWIEGMQEEEAKLKEIWATVQQLLIQRNRLIELFPHNRSTYERQCNDLILTEALAVKELITIEPN